MGPVWLCAPWHRPGSEDFGLRPGDAPKGLPRFGLVAEPGGSVRRTQPVALGR